MSNLPTEVQEKLDEYIERIKAIQWFKPSKNLKKAEVERVVAVALKGFGVTAEVEYRSLSTPSSWDAAWGAAWDAAWGACEIIVSDLDTYTGKYPNGSFVNLIPLWEAGLYPIGIVEGKFLIYVPPSKLEFPSDLV